MVRSSALLAVLLSYGRGLSLLGAGEGRGSCPAAPYRAVNVAWPEGCPPSLPCCSEYGFCQTEQQWRQGQFRDCNGLSNGNSIPDDVIKLEAFFAAIKFSGFKFGGPIGPIVIGNNGPIGGSGGEPSLRPSLIYIDRRLFQEMLVMVLGQVLGQVLGLAEL